MENKIKIKTSKGFVYCKIPLAGKRFKHFAQVGNEFTVVKTIDNIAYIHQHGCTKKSYTKDSTTPFKLEQVLDWILQGIYINVEEYKHPHGTQV
jgi:hypothetical protein